MEGMEVPWSFEDEELISGSLLDELVGEIVHYMVEMGFGTVDISRDEFGVLLRFRAIEDRARELFKPLEVSEVTLFLKEGEGVLTVEVEMSVALSSVRRPAFYVKVDRGVSEAGLLDKPLEGHEELMSLKSEGDQLVVSFRKRYESERLLDRLADVIDEERYVSLGELLFRDLKSLLWRFAALLPME